MIFLTLILFITLILSLIIVLVRTTLVFLIMIIVIVMVVMIVMTMLIFIVLMTIMISMVVKIIKIIIMIIIIVLIDLFIVMFHKQSSDTYIKPSRTSMNRLKEPQVKVLQNRCLHKHLVKPKPTRADCPQPLHRPTCPAGG